MTRTVTGRAARLVAPGALLLAFALVPAMATAAPPGFSDQPRQVTRAVDPAPNLTNLAVGTHPGFDRVVVTFFDTVPGYRLAYVDRIVEEGSGLPVSLRGDADLELVIQPATTQGEEGGTTVPTTRFVRSYPALREARIVGDFEGIVTIGIGASRRTGFRVTELSGPPRLVVDLAHPEGAGGTGPRQTTTTRAPSGSSAAGSATTTTAVDAEAGGATTTTAAAVPGDSAPPAQAAGERRGGLPFSGVWAVILLLIGLALAVAGGWLVIAARRRREWLG